MQKIQKNIPFRKRTIFPVRITGNKRSLPQRLLGQRHTAVSKSESVQAIILHHCVPLRKVVLKMIQENAVSIQLQNIPSIQEAGFI